MQPPPRRHTPGFTVPGSQVGVPASAQAGSTIEGIAPSGSRVEAAGQVVEVGADRRFRLRIPMEASGKLPVRVVRANGTVLVLRIEVTASP